MDKFTEMNVFVEVTRQKSFSAAARKLRLSPSSVSKIITRMEERLESRLFTRSTRKLQLTEGGQQFFEKCVHILEAVDEAEDQLVDEQHHVKGVLTLNSSPGFARYQLIPCLAKFLTQHPHLELNLQFSGQKIDLIKENVDLAIRLGQLDDSNLIARKLGESRRIICATPAYIEKFGEPKRPTDLTSHNCLRLSTNLSFNNWEFTVAGKKQLITVNGNFITDTVEALHDLLLQDQGIARLSEFMIGEEIKNGKLIPLLEEYNNQMQQIHIVYPHRDHLPAKTKIFIEYLLSVFVPTPPWEQNK